jgi:hypothetical protein
VVVVDFFIKDVRASPAGLMQTVTLPEQVVVVMD